MWAALHFRATIKKHNDLSYLLNIVFIEIVKYVLGVYEVSGEKLKNFLSILAVNKFEIFSLLKLQT